MLNPNATSSTTPSSKTDLKPSSELAPYDLTCRRPSQRLLLRARSEVYREQQKGLFRSKLLL